MSYEKQGFADGQVLKAEHLVKMEEAIQNTSWNDLKDKPFQVREMEYFYDGMITVGEGGSITIWSSTECLSKNDKYTIRIEDSDGYIQYEYYNAASNYDSGYSFLNYSDGSTSITLQGNTDDYEDGLYRYTGTITSSEINLSAFPEWHLLIWQPNQDLIDELDEKFIPDTIMRVKDHSWDSLTDKPFEYSVGKVLIDTVVDNYVQYSTRLLYNDRVLLKNDSWYSIDSDIDSYGPYVIKASTLNDLGTEYIYVGNASLLNSVVADNGIHFCIYTYDGKNVYVRFSESGTHSLSIRDVTYKQLDDYFISDRIRYQLNTVYFDTEDSGVTWTCEYTTAELIDLYFKSNGRVIGYCADQRMTFIMTNCHPTLNYCYFVSHVCFENNQIYILECTPNNKVICNAYYLDNDNVRNTNNGGIILKTAGSFTPGEGASALGGACTATGDYAFAEGYETIAEGDISHTEGFGTIAGGNCQHVEGMYNKVDRSGTYLHIIGNGEDSDNRSNAHTVDRDGNAWYAGKVYVGGTSQDDAEVLATENQVRAMINEAIVISSSTEGSSKKFRITVDDEGTISAEELELAM